MIDTLLGIPASYLSPWDLAKLMLVEGGEDGPGPVAARVLPLQTLTHSVLALDR